MPLDADLDMPLPKTPSPRPAMPSTNLESYDPLLDTDGDFSPFSFSPPDLESYDPRLLPMGEEPLAKSPNRSVENFFLTGLPGSELLLDRVGSSSVSPSSAKNSEMETESDCCSGGGPGKAPLR